MRGRPGHDGRVLSHTLGVENPALVVVLLFIAMGLLALAIVSGRVRDAVRLDP